MDVRFYERRCCRIGTALGREDRRAIQLVQNPPSGDDRFWHTRHMPIHSGHVNLDRGLGPRRGRGRIASHARNGDRR